MKISVGSWAFSFGPFADNPVPFDRIARRLSEAGYDGIEVSGFPPHVTLERYPTGQSRRDLARFLADVNLGVSGYAADFTLANPVVPANRERYLDLFRRNVELAAEIGSPSLRVDTVAAPGSIDERDYRDAFARLAELWREAAEIAQGAGVLMVWEFEPGFAFNKPREVLGLHQLVNHRNFKILFDTCHAYMCSVAAARQHGTPERLERGVEEFLEMLAGRLGHIHLIDSDGILHGDETSRHCPFGLGFIDFPALAPRLLQVPNIRWWCIDMCFCADAWERVEASRGYVMDLLGTRAVMG